MVKPKLDTNGTGNTRSIRVWDRLEISLEIFRGFGICNIIDYLTCLPDYIPVIHDITLFCIYICESFI